MDKKGSEDRKEWGLWLWKERKWWGGTGVLEEIVYAVAPEEVMWRSKYS